MMNSNVSKFPDASSSPPSNVCDVVVQSKYLPQKESSFVDPETYLLDSDIFFEPTFEGFESLPSPETPENPVYTTCTNLPPSHNRNVHNPQECKDTRAPVPSPSPGPNPLDHFTHTRNNSDPGYACTISPHHHPCNASPNRFVSPSPSRRPFYQDTFPSYLHQQHFQFGDAAHLQPMCSGVNAGEYYYNECPYSPCKSATCPNNNPSVPYKQTHGKSAGKETPSTSEHEPVTKENDLLPHFQSSLDPSSSSGNTLQQVAHSEEPGAENKIEYRRDFTTTSYVESDTISTVFSQNSSCYYEDDSLCSTQQSVCNTQTSALSEEVLSPADVALQQEEWSPSGKELIFSPGLDKSPAQKTKALKKKKNNCERERQRVRSMNTAFRQLGDVCATFTHERATTKLATIQQALSVLDKFSSLKRGETLASKSDN